ncbi:MAG: LacI family DNA-binding transcriptional regulator [Myxococcota bacterium]
MGQLARPAEQRLRQHRSGGRRSGAALEGESVAGPPPSVGRTRVTIHDVAAAAGVSIATVSRVLSGTPGAGAEVRERVVRIATELGYRSDSVARSLRNRRSDMLGVLIPDITNPFFPALIQAIEVQLQARGDGLLLADAQGDVALEAERVRSMLDRRMDALLIAPTDERGSAAIIEEALGQVPVVQVDRRACASAPYVGVDHDGAIQDIVEHLRAGGRRRFAFVGYARGVSTSEDRVEALLRHTADIDPGAADRVLREEVADGVRIPDDWLDRIVGDADCVITTSDLIAISLRDSLLARNQRIPEDIALVSFDDTPLAAAAGLTSVRQPLRDLAAASIGLVRGTAPTLPQKGFPATLIVRRSSGSSTQP